MAGLLGNVVEGRFEAFVDDALANLRPFEISRTVPGEVCEKVLNVLVDIRCEYVVLVESIKDKLDMSRTLDQCPYKDPNLLRETATSEGDHRVEGADRPDGFQQAELSDARFTVAVSGMLLAGVIENRRQQ
jgi:hypothetical protein